MRAVRPDVHSKYSINRFSFSRISQHSAVDSPACLRAIDEAQVWLACMPLRLWLAMELCCRCPMCGDSAACSGEFGRRVIVPYGSVGAPEKPMLLMAPANTSCPSESSCCCMAVVIRGCTDVSVSKHQSHAEFYKTKTQPLHCVYLVLLWTYDHSCAARTSATRSYCQRL